MKKYRYNDTSGVYDLTEDEIIEQYFDYWSGEMKRIGREDLISKDRCIDDFLTIHWAWEIE